MRILVIGGTQFVGRHIVEAALAGGHEVTLFHRGRTGDDLFPEATHVHGDRDGDLAPLGDGEWDATIDVSAYLPRQVRALAAALDGRGGRYVFVSTTSVYADPTPYAFTEDAPLAELAEPDTEQVTAETYGGLKVLCERAAADAFADGLLVVRPTYVVGPYDHTGRFTWWLHRLHRGGEVLAPGPADAPLSVIDARDMASWVVDLVERAATGTFHAVSPRPPFTFADLLEAVRTAVAPEGTTLTWADPAFLKAAGIDGAALPLWGEDEPGQAADPAAAYAAGLSPRPLDQTIRETLAHEQAQPTKVTRDVGIAPDREADLLADLGGR